MAEGQYGPLNVSLVRTLTDKLYEKRKAAALDIEKSVVNLACMQCEINQIQILDKCENWWPRIRCRRWKSCWKC